MMKFLILLLYLPFVSLHWNYMSKNFKVPPKTRGPGPTSTRRPDATTRELFYFEGVDYYAMPTELMKKNTDCHAHFGWCLQNMPIMNPVCGWNYWSYRLDDYYSPCEIEVQNCRFRMQRLKKAKNPQMGDDMRNDKVYYNGEGYDCRYYARMGGDPVANYFGNGRRMAYYEKFIKNRIADRSN